MVEFIDVVDDGSYPSMMVGDVEVPGIFDISEQGGGFTEKYKTEYEARAGGQDTADEPPAAKLTVKAAGTDETWEGLNNLRQQREPFSVEIGQFTFSEMGITDLQRTMNADNPDTNWLKIELQEFREVVIQRQTQSNSEGEYGFDDGSGGGGGGGGGPAPSPPRDSVSDELDGNAEPVNVPAGGRPTRSVGSGETLAHWLFDISANNASAVVSSNGSNWTIRDCGWRGQCEPHDAMIGPNASGGGNIISNIYLGDGSISAHTGPTGIWVNNSSTGSMTMEHINVQSWGDNGIYASAPLGDAEIHIRDSYGRNSGVANFRLAKGSLTNITSIHGNDYPHSHMSRAVWAWQPGPVEIRDSDILAQVEDALIAGEDAASTVNIYDTEISGNVAAVSGSTINRRQNVGNNPDTSPPGIPTSAVDAANGIISTNETGGN